eukprot:CAMPEP_0202827190 /NCGR_PEP_ID=MMETSP1389-20130828/14109_1 /ASSEMBLY_ACC=CAM_ASM_000865 /TAXON_ID=302021 /ORGANISM="Rhodomonas sp., Strain CCMP768" /LENGTH=99 /DNA_ID=CAMNT_0049500565 /DNA_START=154 /DNA_END=450 /DNA_ORIENTATION=-
MVRPCDEEEQAVLRRHHGVVVDALHQRLHPGPSRGAEEVSCFEHLLDRTLHCTHQRRPEPTLTLGVSSLPFLLPRRARGREEGKGGVDVGECRLELEAL